MSVSRAAPRSSAHQPAPTLVIPDRDADLAPSAVPFPSPTRPESSSSPASTSSSSPSRPPSPSMPTSAVASPSRRSPSHNPHPPPLRPTFMRVRQTSLPASLVQSRHYSIVGSSGLSATATSTASGGAKRVSVVSFASFESLPEEDGEGDVDGAEVGRPSIARRSLSPPATPLRPAAAKRSSLPASSSALGRSVSVVRPRTLSARTSSPSRWSIMSEGEREKHAETRWRIAEELRESERAYVKVLEEVDAMFYQPLVEALPADDPLSRRSSKRYSTSAQPDSRTASPRHSLYGSPQPRSRTSTAESLLSSAPSTTSTTSPPPTQPILSRREINEVFSNFSDVLNLAHVMLLALEEAVPPRPSQPVSIQPGAAAALGEPAATRSAPTAGATSSQASSIEDGVEAAALSRSGGSTVDSSEGPDTPDQSPPASSARKVVPRQRPLSTRSTERRRSTPVAPPVRLGKALLPVLPFFKQYSLFIANFSASLALLSRLDGSASSTSSALSAARWQAFVASRQQHPVDGEAHSQARKIGLAGLLLNIVQRVPRYRLLLKDLLRHTDEDHPDARDLQAAFDLVDSVASHLDSQISAHTSALALLDLQRTFLPGSFPTSPLVAPGRTLLKAGPLSQVSHSGSPRPRTVFLFSDLLVVAAAEEAWIGDEARFRLVGRYELDEVTVVGNEEVDEEGRRRCGIQVLSRERSFAVYAGTLDERDVWLDAIRSAKAALMSARATIQRSDLSAPLAALSTSPSPNKLDRRISLPPPSPSPTAPQPLARTRSTSSHLAVPPSRQVSLPPPLGFIPPSPAEELDRLVFPSTPSAPSGDFVQSPLEGPPLLERVEARAGSPALAASSSIGPGPAILSSTSSSTSSSTPAAGSSPSSPPSRPSLTRTRRWSELGTSSAFAALSSVFLPSPPSSSPDLASGDTAYPVIDAYQAPVWVPDSRAHRCQNCKKEFGVWRRRHHCRLCGGVVCWECSTKYFIIPAAVLSSSSLNTSLGPSPPLPSAEPERLARACDSCYSSVFAPTTPASRFLDAHPTATDTLPRLGMRGGGGGTGSVKWTGTWRMSKALGPLGGLEPLWDLEELAAVTAVADGVEGRQGASAASAGQGGARRTRKRSAVNQLKALLGE
ncbi:hypothetical protein JCM8208_007342 [Rhodotorula glutinis]